MGVAIDEFNVIQTTVAPKLFVDNFNIIGTDDPALLAGAPTIVSLTPLDSAAVLTLTAPPNMGSGTFVAYRVTAGSRVYVTTGTTMTLMGLINSIPTTVSVTTETTVGSSSAAVAAVTPDAPPPGGTLPDAPTSLVVTPYDSALGLAWTAPGSFGSSSFSDYLVTASSILGTRYYSVATTSLMAGYLTNDVEWSIEVVARTGSGVSLPLTGTGTSLATAGTPTSPVLPYSSLPPTPTPGTSPIFPVDYIAPAQGVPIDNTDLPPDLPPVPEYVPEPSIVAFYPEGMNDSAGYFNPSNWAGL